MRNEKQKKYIYIERKPRAFLSDGDHRLLMSRFLKFFFYILSRLYICVHLSILNIIYLRHFNEKELSSDVSFSFFRIIVIVVVVFIFLTVDMQIVQ